MLVVYSEMFLELNQSIYEISTLANGIFYFIFQTAEFMDSLCFWIGKWNNFYYLFIHIIYAIYKLKFIFNDMHIQNIIKNSARVPLTDQLNFLMTLADAFYPIFVAY